MAGWRTTYGSPLFADNVPDHDELLVERIRRAGAVPIGKTNVPEFAAGRHTFNTDLRHHPQPGRPDAVSAGGSSGGAACALASGHGAAGRRLRHGRLAAQPGVVLRRGRAAAQSLGRVPEWPLDNQWESTSRRRPDGPQRRRPRAAALGARRPRPAGAAGARRPGLDVRAAARRLRCAGLRVALSADLGGAFEVDDEVAASVVATAAAVSPPPARRSRPRTRTSPWPTTPSARCAPGTSRPASATLLAEHPDEFKPSLADNIRAGEALTGADVARAYRQRTALARPMRQFFDVVRRAGAAGLARCRRSRPTRSSPTDDQRPADGDVPRLDAVGVPHHRHRLPGDLGARRAAPRDGLPGRRPARRAARRRPPAARGRGRLRVRHRPAVTRCSRPGCPARRALSVMNTALQPAGLASVAHARRPDPQQRPHGAAPYAYASVVTAGSLVFTAGRLPAGRRRPVSVRPATSPARRPA